MSIEELRQIERFHGIAAWIAIALLFVATVALFRTNEQRRLHLALCASALACLSLTGALGLMLEGAYRSRLKQKLFMQASSLGWLFERKEHFAFGSILLAFAALTSLGAAYLFASARPGTRASEAASAKMLARELMRSAKVAWTTATVLAFAAAIAAAQVARRIHF